MERCVQFKAESHDLFLLQMDERSDDYDVSLAGSCLNQTLKCLVILRAAIRVAGAILLYRADKDLFRADHLRPTHRRREKMRVAEGDVSDWYGSAYHLAGGGIGHRNGGIRKRRTAYFSEYADAERQ